MKRIDINSGDVFNNLTVVKESDPSILPSGQINRVILCKCVCGKTKKVRLLHLVRGRIKSCGCLTGEFHGESSSLLYNVWRGMRNRSKSYHSERHLYYDRGIRVCDQWRESYTEFKKFAEKNGWKPGLTIDRINNDKGYFPENCRFVTSRENCNNRRNTVMFIYKGKRYPLQDLLRIVGKSGKDTTVLSRIKRGWTIEDAFDKPIRSGNYKGFRKLKSSQET